ncbi:MAG: hypothetical protein E6H07_02810 [Bacteroidetes bacterium]|nr:MAG: hypothetical protein E6H07_02810 [Bacteroidota bacterium]
MEDKNLSGKESLELITQMINRAKNSYHDTGIGAMMWGAVITICSLVRLSEIHFGYRLPFDIYLLTLAAIIPQIIISIKEKKERKVKSYDDAFMDYLWLGFGISIFLLIHICNIIFNEWDVWADSQTIIAGNKTAFSFYEFVAPLFLMLYGMPTFVTGAACKFKPMLWGGLLCWVCSIITVYTPIKLDLLLTALSALFAWFIPGLLMEKEYRIYKKEQVAQHV